MQVVCVGSVGINTRPTSLWNNSCFFSLPSQESQLTDSILTSVVHSLTKAQLHCFTSALQQSPLTPRHSGRFFSKPQTLLTTVKMRFAATAAVFAATAMAGQVVYETEYHTITSCKPEITDCPARSTVTSSTVYAKTTTPAGGEGGYPVQSAPPAPTYVSPFLFLPPPPRLAERIAD